MSFESKPKSAATEFVPSKVLKYIEEHKEELSKFLSNESLATRFINNEVDKFNIMQVSRKYKGKLTTLSSYEPSNLLRYKSVESLQTTLKTLLSENTIYGRAYVNGQPLKDVTEPEVEKIAHFLS